VRRIIQAGPRIFCRLHFCSVADIFRVTLDGLNERGTTRSLQNLLSMLTVTTTSTGRVLIETADVDIFVLSGIRVKGFACFLCRYFLEVQGYS